MIDSWKEPYPRWDSDPAPADAASGTTLPHVLVADDDPSVRRSVRRLLGNEGLLVTAVPDGRAALATFRAHPPDLVMLDVIMPGTSGLEVCRVLKSDRDTCLTPVVLLSGLDTSADRVRGIEAGADEFLTKPFDVTELIARVRSLLRVKRFTEELERAEHVLFALARAVEGRDAATEHHCERIARYSVALGRVLDLPDRDLRALYRAGFLHDLGKVAIPDSILLKPGPLTPAERAVMEEHPVIGERICSDLKCLAPVRPIIRHHHERYDGTGYPDGLTGHDIPLGARILQLADVFDALTNARPYRRPVNAEAALTIMRSEVARGWWDPDLFAQFAARQRCENALPHVRGRNHDHRA